MHAIIVPKLLNQNEKLKDNYFANFGDFLEKGKKLEMHSEILPPYPPRLFGSFLVIKAEEKKSESIVRS